MLIGITYDLRQDYLDLGFGEEETAEFDHPNTINSIDSTLKILGYETEKIGNVWNLTKNLAAGKKWDLVFNIAEGLFGLSREAQVPALLEAFNIPYVFSDPLVLSVSLQKGMAKRVFRDLGIPTADFMEIHNPEDIENVKLPFPLFAKPIAEGTGKGISKSSHIKDKIELKQTCTELLAKFKQPVLLETYLPGREFTVGITGTGNKAESVGIMEITLSDKAEQYAYSFENKENWEGRVSYKPVDDPEAKLAVKTALDAWKGLGCRDGGRVDVRSDAKGIPNIIEINPLAGLRPNYSDLPMICDFYGITYTELIRTIMNSALERVSNDKFFPGKI